uniref:Uncharacterized protein n=1 Tax=Chromera velia CCMP2878 TaxID=1169474 RepID=A0A0G4FJM2_9ALVE|eukprot:Cvel_17379.t1-p1 / transcript=Cvel_17379.t1 / gene=Cvel_17379 / organism=Chromera_velia_CCMP2878 / gene_product=hypothetical protein / transcript_product=hypothetical protein / location=Cvel_scaffold1382:21102-28843(-) / protein_length=2215 / sequence_SO=supercontig / SO=protein_coding / is_pseudo=false
MNNPVPRFGTEGHKRSPPCCPSLSQEKAEALMNSLPLFSAWVRTAKAKSVDGGGVVAASPAKVGGELEQKGQPEEGKTNTNQSATIDSLEKHADVGTGGEKPLDGGEGRVEVEEGGEGAAAGETEGIPHDSLMAELLDLVHQRAGKLGENFRFALVLLPKEKEADAEEGVLEAGQRKDTKPDEGAGEVGGSRVFSRKAGAGAGEVLPSELTTSETQVRVLEDTPRDRMGEDGDGEEETILERRKSNVRSPSRDVVDKEKEEGEEEKIPMPSADTQGGEMKKEVFVPWASARALLNLVLSERNREDPASGYGHHHGGLLPQTEDSEEVQHAAAAAKLASSSAAAVGQHPEEGEAEGVCGEETDKENRLKRKENEGLEERAVEQKDGGTAGIEAVEPNLSPPSRADDHAVFPPLPPFASSTRGKSGDSAKAVASWHPAAEATEGPLELEGCGNVSTNPHAMPSPELFLPFRLRPRRFCGAWKGVEGLEWGDEDEVDETTQQPGSFSSLSPGGRRTLSDIAVEWEPIWEVTEEANSGAVENVPGEGGDKEGGGDRDGDKGAPVASSSYHLPPSFDGLSSLVPSNSRRPPRSRLPTLTSKETCRRSSSLPLRLRFPRGRPIRPSPLPLEGSSKAFHEKEGGTETRSEGLHLPIESREERMAKEGQRSKQEKEVNRTPAGSKAQADGPRGKGKQLQEKERCEGRLWRVVRPWHSADVAVAPLHPGDLVSTVSVRPSGFLVVRRIDGPAAISPPPDSHQQISVENIDQQQADDSEAEVFVCPLHILSAASPTTAASPFQPLAGLSLPAPIGVPLSGRPGGRIDLKGADAGEKATAASEALHKPGPIPPIPPAAAAAARGGGADDSRLPPHPPCVAATKFLSQSLTHRGPLAGLPADSSTAAPHAHAPPCVPAGLESLLKETRGPSKTIDDNLPPPPPYEESLGRLQGSSVPKPPQPPQPQPQPQTATTAPPFHAETEETHSPAGGIEGKAKETAAAGALGVAVNRQASEELKWAMPPTDGPPVSPAAKNQQDIPPHYHTEHQPAAVAAVRESAAVPPVPHPPERPIPPPPLHHTEREQEEKRQPEKKETSHLPVLMSAKETASEVKRHATTMVTTVPPTASTLARLRRATALPCSSQPAAVPSLAVSDAEDDLPPGYDEPGATVACGGRITFPQAPLTAEVLEQQQQQQQHGSNSAASPPFSHHRPPLSPSWPLSQPNRQPPTVHPTMQQGPPAGPRHLPQPPHRAGGVATAASYGGPQEGTPQSVIPLSQLPPFGTHAVAPLEAAARSPSIPPFTANPPVPVPVPTSRGGLRGRSVEAAENFPRQMLQAEAAAGGGNFRPAVAAGPSPHPPPGFEVAGVVSASRGDRRHDSAAGSMRGTAESLQRGARGNALPPDFNDTSAVAPPPTQIVPPSAEALRQLNNKAANQPPGRFPPPLQQPDHFNHLPPGGQGGPPNFPSHQSPFHHPAQQQHLSSRPETLPPHIDARALQPPDFDEPSHLDSRGPPQPFPMHPHHHHHNQLGGPQPMPPHEPAAFHPHQPPHQQPSPASGPRLIPGGGGGDAPSVGPGPMHAAAAAGVTAGALQPRLGGGSTHDHSGFPPNASAAFPPMPTQVPPPFNAGGGMMTPSEGGRGPPGMPQQTGMGPGGVPHVAQPQTSAQPPHLHDAFPPPRDSAAPPPFPMAGAESMPPSGGGVDPQQHPMARNPLAHAAGGLPPVYPHILTAQTGQQQQPGSGLLQNPTQQQQGQPGPGPGGPLSQQLGGPRDPPHHPNPNFPQGPMPPGTAAPWPAGQPPLQQQQQGPPPGVNANAPGGLGGMPDMPPPSYHQRMGEGPAPYGGAGAMAPPPAYSNSLPPPPHLQQQQQPGVSDFVRVGAMRPEVPPHDPHQHMHMMHGGPPHSSNRLQQLAPMTSGFSPQTGAGADLQTLPPTAQGQPLPHPNELPTYQQNDPPAMQQQQQQQPYPGMGPQQPQQQQPYAPRSAFPSGPTPQQQHPTLGPGGGGGGEMMRQQQQQPNNPPMDPRMQMGGVQPRPQFPPPGAGGGGGGGPMSTHPIGGPLNPNLPQQHQHHGPAGGWMGPGPGPDRFGGPQQQQQQQGLPPQYGEGPGPGGPRGGPPQFPSQQQQRENGGQMSPMDPSGGSNFPHMQMHGGGMGMPPPSQFHLGGPQQQQQQQPGGPFGQQPGGDPRGGGNFLGGNQGGGILGPHPHQQQQHPYNYPGPGGTGGRGGARS